MEPAQAGPNRPRWAAPAAAVALLLLSPYAAGDSFLTVLAIGLIPPIVSGNLWAILLLLLADLPYLASRGLLFYQSANYWTIVLILTAGPLAAQA